MPLLPSTPERSPSAQKDVGCAQARRAVSRGVPPPTRSGSVIARRRFWDVAQSFGMERAPVLCRRHPKPHRDARVHEIATVSVDPLGTVGSDEEEERRSRLLLADATRRPPAWSGWAVAPAQQVGGSPSPPRGLPSASVPLPKSQGGSATMSGPLTRGAGHLIYLLSAISARVSGRGPDSSLRATLRSDSTIA